MTPCRRLWPLLLLLLLLLHDLVAAASFFGEQFDLNAPATPRSRWPAARTTEPLDEVELIEARSVGSGGGGGGGGGGSPRGAQRNAGPGSEVPGPDGPPPTASIDEVFCDFGPLPQQSLCEWQDGCGALKWSPGTGLATNWLGGPSTDSTAGTMEGGYAFLECSSPAPKTDPAADEPLSPNGLMHSPQLGSTGVVGTCFMFKFAMDGLSSAGLRVLLHVGRDEFSSTVTRANDSRPATVSCPRAFPSGANAAAAQLQLEERVLWHAHYHSLGVWQQAQILYTFPELHTLIIEGMPVDVSDPSRSYRGYIAIDDIDLQPGTSCVSFCNFAGGFCDWTNDIDDDFDWSISRGSSKPTTGPVMDRDASQSSGGYAYIDSSWPRRPGDAARLVSVSMPSNAPDAPLCMHFSFHMFGSGIGELKLAVRHSRTLDAPLHEIWRLKGNAGNAWFDSRVTVASLDDFQLVFEATVGNTAMGDIAIDDVSFTGGPCPTSPQVAAPAHYPRDCTFEIDECEWLNSREPGTAGAQSLSGPVARSRVDWERISQSTLSPRNQRKSYTLPATRPRQEYFMALQSRGVGIPGTAYLSSATIKPNGDPLCLTFWYLMFESFIDATGPSLGVLRVLVQPVGETLETAVPIWQLYNNQGPMWNYGQALILEKKEFNILFEGTWGPNRATGNIAIDDIAFYAGNCTVRPSSALVRAQDCSFEKGLCGWENVTSGGVNDPRLQWQRAFPNHRPAQLLDKTFGSSGDFVFFDIFSPNMRREVRLRSPIVSPSPDEDATCFTFWFVAFGVEESTSLRVVKLNAAREGNAGSESFGVVDEDEESDQQVLWSVTAKGFNNLRPSWTWAQVTIETRSPYRLMLEGGSSNGGFAIDDIKFQPGVCPTRPAAGKPSTGVPEF